MQIGSRPECVTFFLVHKGDESGHNSCETFEAGVSRSDCGPLLAVMLAASTLAPPGGAVIIGRENTVAILDKLTIVRLLSPHLVGHLS